MSAKIPIMMITKSISLKEKLLTFELRNIV